MFDHEKLDVYRISLDFAAWSYNLAKRLKGADRHAGVQLLRASQSIPFLQVCRGNHGCGRQGRTPQGERAGEREEQYAVISP